MKFFLSLTLILFTLILCITSLPQVPDFGISSTIFVKLTGPIDNGKKPAVQVFPLDSDLNIEWTSEGIRDDPTVLIQAYYIFPTTPKETYVPLLKEPKETNLSDKLFKLKLGSNLFEAEEKFYLVTVTLKNDPKVVGTSEPFGVCDKCE